MSNRTPPRVSWVLLVVLVAALATGAAASILVSASTAPPPASGPAPLVYLPLWVFSAASAAVLFGLLATMVIWKLQSKPNALLNRMAVVILVAVLLAVLFIVFAHPFGPAAFSNSSGKSSQSGGGQTGSGGGKNLTGPGGNIVNIPNLPGWVPFAVLAGVLLLVVVVVVPQVRSYLADRRLEGVPPLAASAISQAGVREALGRASAQLEGGSDPRAVILALYAAILYRLRPMVGDIDSSTPEEIRAGHLVRLGVRPEAARTLTRLFEEARYSVHPMGSEDGVRARQAVQSALDDLDRRNFLA